jgi:hypothetical protein
LIGRILDHLDSLKNLREDRLKDLSDVFGIDEQEGGSMDSNAKI